MLSLSVSFCIVLLAVTSIAQRLCNSTIARANATGIFSYAVDYPSIDTILHNTEGDTVVNIPDPSWAVTVDALSGEKSWWYDTAGQNYSVDLGIGYDVCAYLMTGLPLNTVKLGQNDPGDCSSTLSPKYRDEILTRAALSASKWSEYASPPPYSNLSAGVLPSICSYILSDLEEDGLLYPKECAKEFDLEHGEVGSVTSTHLPDTIAQSLTIIVRFRPAIRRFTKSPRVPSPRKVGTTLLRGTLVQS